MEGTPVHLKSLYLSAGEAEIAHVLDQIALAMPHVAIGSYPQWDESLGYRVKITVEHEQAEPVEEVVRQLMERLPARSILRAE
jgi:molybdopterin-biosynthesis enzyme MoeA-like protein